MTEQLPPRAEIRVGPGVDEERIRAVLARHGMQIVPLDPVAPAQRNVPTLVALAAGWWESLPAAERETLLRLLRVRSVATLLVGPRDGSIPPAFDNAALVSVWLDEPIGPAALQSAVRTALETVVLRLEVDDVRVQLKRRTEQMEDVQRVGIALSAEKNLETLQTLILRTARQVTSADAGTLYLVSENADKEKVLIFQYSQNDSVDAPYQRQVMPLSTKSLSGYSAITGQTVRIADAYALPADAPYGFNTWFDTNFRYRTTSMMAVPMENREGEVVGVIQLLNRKRDFSVRLTPENTLDDVIPFTDDDQRLLSSFASQAAVALENQMLIESIQRLFAGFVSASVKAIEARDPTTFGHSDRVANLSVAIARTINDTRRGAWADIHFTTEQLRELEYAGLLHDFGKVGVREHVLVKPKKLYDWRLEQIRSRFHLARQQAETRGLRTKLDYVLRHGVDSYLIQEAALSAETEQALADLDGALGVVLAANEPTVLEQERFEWLVQVAERTMQLPSGETVPLVDEEDMVNLSIRKGTLNEEERREIESHVTHSFEFLIQIPWTKDLQGIPNIAYAHHEKLNGMGYPRKLSAEQIPIQARMMTIADIFDALTASDRPYKPAVPLPRALQILGFEAKDGGIDAELLDLFIERQVYRAVLSPEALGEMVESAG
jgi:HD-GYP domain-containing protein (c-di-GMP phosphodiesterase class II)